MGNKTKTTNFYYDKKYTFEQRCADSKFALDSTGGSKVPVVIQRGNKKIEIEDEHDIGNKKYLVSCDMTLAKFMCSLRKKIPSLREGESIWLFVNGVLPPTSATIGSIYNQHKSDDGILKMVFYEENVFG